jgi:hypothetical protein
MLSGGVFKFGTGWVINLELKEATDKDLYKDLYRPLWSFCFSSRDHRSCIIQRCLWKDFVLQIITIKILF